MIIIRVTHFLWNCLKSLKPLIKFLKKIKKLTELVQKKTLKCLFLGQVHCFFAPNSVNLKKKNVIGPNLSDKYEENDVWHDNFKKYFFSAM